MSDRTAIEWIMFCNNSGYSQAAQDYILAITDDYDVRIKLLHPAPLTGAITAQRQLFFNSLIAKPSHPSALQIYHCTPQLQRRVARRGKTVGFATFETTYPPNEWVATLNKNDAVIAPSRFCKAVFEKSGVTSPIHHLPHCIDTSLYHADVPPARLSYLRNHEGKFKFLFFGSWKLRKGWPQLLEAYWKEFGPDDNVILVLKTDHGSDVLSDIERHKRELGLSGKELPPVLLETKVLDEQRLPSFLKTFDCLVFPTLGEGFGLPPLQCMALGVPVIATDYSGCQDYLSAETATLIEPEGFVTYQMLDRISQFRGKAWAFVTVRRVREAMRSVTRNVDEVKRRAIAATNLVEREFSYAATVQRFSLLADCVGAKG